MEFRSGEFIPRGEGKKGDGGMKPPLQERGQGRNSVLKPRAREAENGQTGKKHKARIGLKMNVSS